MPNTMPTTTPADAMTLSVRDAARVLGTSPEAVRKRLDRGTLHGVKRGRQWVVYLSPADLPSDAGQDAGADAVVHDNTMPRDPPADAAPDALVTALREEITFLRQTLDRQGEELRRRDHLLAAALERIPELPANTPSPDTPQGAKAAPVRDDSPAPARDSLLDRLRRSLRLS